MARIVAVVRAGGRTPQEAAALPSLTEEQILAIEAAQPTAGQQWLINEARTRLRVEVGEALTALGQAAPPLSRRRRVRPTRGGRRDFIAERMRADNGANDWSRPRGIAGCQPPPYATTVGVVAPAHS